jgi:epsilon-lactone hydrolase
MTFEPKDVPYEEVPEVDGLRATPPHRCRRIGDHVPVRRRYMISSPRSRRKFAAPVANSSRARTVVPRCRLAPEHPFPATIEDAMAAYRRLLQGGFRPEQVVVRGDSSAGGLTVVMPLKLRDDGARLPGSGVCISPWVDLACTGETLDTRSGVDLTAIRLSLQRMAGQYPTLRTHARRSPPRCTPTSWACRPGW